MVRDKILVLGRTRGIFNLPSDQVGVKDYISQTCVIVEIKGDHSMEGTAGGPKARRHKYLSEVLSLQVVDILHGRNFKSRGANKGLQITITNR